jgi:hypothetical protein
VRSERASFGFHRAAAGAGLGGELAADLGEARVLYVPGEAMVGEHPGDVEVLDHDRAVGGGEHRGELVDSVPALVGDLPEDALRDYIAAREREALG